MLVEKLNLFNFTHVPKQKSLSCFYHYPPGRRELPILPKQHFLKIFFPEQKEGGRIMELKKLPKLKKILSFDNGSQVLINSIIFATFTFFVYFLLWNNLDSSTLKYEGSLILLIKFSLKSRMCRSNYMK